MSEKDIEQNMGIWSYEMYYTDGVKLIFLQITEIKK